MDPVTHAVVGAAVAVLGGADVSLSSPEFSAAIIGALSPDLDIIYQYWGDYVYLKHHRGLSHSLPGLLGFSALTAGLLSVFYPAAGFFLLFAWAFFGALSHTFLDLLNSYGVMLFYPFSRKKYTLNLLMITDPFLIASSSAVIISGALHTSWIWPAAAAGLIYLYLRFLMRRRAERLIKDYYSEHLEKLIVMPAFFGLVKWDFIVCMSKKNIIGQIDLFSCKINIHKKLKLISNELKDVLLKTKIAKVFKEFTPFMHIDCRIEENRLIGNFTDMRYYVRNNFLHHATVIVNSKNMQVEKALFQPYSPRNKIEIN